MNISEFEFLRQMALTIDRLDGRVAALTEVIKTGRFNHFTIFPEPTGRGFGLLSPGLDLLFPLDDVGTAVTAFSACRARAQDEAKQLRELLEKELAKYPKTTQPG